MDCLQAANNDGARLWNTSGTTAHKKSSEQVCTLSNNLLRKKIISFSDCSDFLNDHFW